MNQKKASKIYENFDRLCPAMACFVKSYELIGPKAIVIHFLDDVSFQKLFFMYYSDENWNLGTKMWRKVPEKKLKSMGDKKNE